MEIFILEYGLYKAVFENVICHDCFIEDYLYYESKIAEIMEVTGKKDIEIIDINVNEVLEIIYKF